MYIEEIVQELRDYCPGAIVNQVWKDGKWYIYAHPVGGMDDSVGLYCIIEDVFLRSLSDEDVIKVGDAVNGHFGISEADR